MKSFSRTRTCNYALCSLHGSTRRESIDSWAFHIWSLNINIQERLPGWRTHCTGDVEERSGWHSRSGHSKSAWNTGSDDQGWPYTGYSKAVSLRGKNVHLKKKKQKFLVHAPCFGHTFVWLLVIPCTSGIQKEHLKGTSYFNVWKLKNKLFPFSSKNNSTLISEVFVQMGQIR